MASELRHTTERGKSAGVEQVPAKDRNGQYTTSSDKYAKNQVKHNDLESVNKAVVDKGHSVRMSPNGRGKNASLISAKK